jgi:hypothetical protein
MRERLKPPRSLLLILALLAMVSLPAVGWFDWRLLDQERLVEGQRAPERLEQSADRISATAARRGLPVATDPHGVHRDSVPADDGHGSERYPGTALGFLRRHSAQDVT